MYCRSTSNKFLLIISIGFSCHSCSTTSEPVNRVDGTIAYPFVAETKSMGKSHSKENFIIKSAVGGSEYSIEIPDANDNYDIQIPLASMNQPATNDALAVGAKGGKAPNPISTDKEMVSALPSLATAKGSEVATMDAALGVGSPEGPVQSPSYSMGIAKINQYYRERNYDLALMELNNALAFYPNSPKLLKMKGTLLLKTGNHQLALKSWQRALDLAPTDNALERSIHRLQERIAAETPVRTPVPSSTAPSSPIDPEVLRLSH